MATVKFPKKYLERLTAVAREEGKSVEQFITDAVSAYMVREKATEEGDSVSPGAGSKKRQSKDH